MDDTTPVMEHQSESETASLSAENCITSEKVTPKEKQIDKECEKAQLNEHGVCNIVESGVEIDDMNLNRSSGKLPEMSQDSVIDGNEECMDVVQLEELDNRQTIISETVEKSPSLNVEREDIDVSGNNNTFVEDESNLCSKDLNPDTSDDATVSTEIDKGSHAGHTEKDVNPVAPYDAAEPSEINDGNAARHIEEDMTASSDSSGSKTQDLQAVQPKGVEKSAAATLSEDNLVVVSSGESHSEKDKLNEGSVEPSGVVSASLEDEAKTNSGDESSLVIDEGSTPSSAPPSTPSSAPPEPPSGSGSEPSTPNVAKEKAKSTRTPRSTAPIDKDLLELLRLPEKYGWKRELVYRGISEGSKVKADVYYHPPKGKKLRSMMDVSSYLSKVDKSPLRPTHFSFRKDKLFEPPFEIVRQANASKNYFAMGKAAKDKEAPKSSPKPKETPETLGKRPIKKPARTVTQWPKETPETLGKRPIKKPARTVTQWAPAGIKFTASKQSIKNAQNTLRNQNKYIVTRIYKTPGGEVTPTGVNPTSLSRLLAAGPSSNPQQTVSGSSPQLHTQNNSVSTGGNVSVLGGKPLWKVRLASQRPALKKNKPQRKPSPLWRPSDSGSNSGSESDHVDEGSGEHQNVEIIRDGLGVASSEADEMTRLMGQPSDLIASIVNQAKTPQQRQADEQEVNRVMGSASDLIASIVRQSKPAEKQQQPGPHSRPWTQEARSFGPYITKGGPSNALSQLLPLPRLTRPGISTLPQTGTQQRFKPRIIVVPPNQYSSIIAGASSGMHTLPLTLVSTPPMLTRPITSSPGAHIAPFVRPPPLLRPAAYAGPPNLTPGAPVAMKAPPPLIHAAVRGPPALQPCPSLLQASPNQQQETPPTALPQLKLPNILNLPQPNQSLPSVSEPLGSAGLTRSFPIVEIVNNGNESDEDDVVVAGSERPTVGDQPLSKSRPANSEVVVSDSSEDESGAEATDTANGPLQKKRAAVCVVSSSEEEGESSHPSKRIRLDGVENKKPIQARGESLDAVKKLVAMRSGTLLESGDEKENIKTSKPDRAPEAIDHDVSSDKSDDDNDVEPRKSHADNGHSARAVDKLVSKWSGRLSESLDKGKVAKMNNGPVLIDNGMLSDNSEDGDEDEFLPPVSFAPPDTELSKSPSNQEGTEGLQESMQTDVEQTTTPATDSYESQNNSSVSKCAMVSYEIQSNPASVSKGKSEVGNKSTGDNISSGAAKCHQQLLTLPSHLRGKLDLRKTLALSINGQEDIIIQPSHVLETKESLKVLLPAGMKLPTGGPGQVLNVAVSNVSQSQLSKHERRKTREFRSSFRLLQESLTIMTKILKLFTLPEILRLSVVNKTWFKMCYQPDLWETISMKGVYVTNWSMAKKFFQRVGVKKLYLSGMFLRRDIEQQSWQHIQTLVSDLKSLSELKFGRVPSNVIEGLMEKLPCSVNISAESILDTNSRGRQTPTPHGRIVDKNVENMSKALTLVHSGMSASNAAKMFNVSETDLVHFRHDREIELTREEKDKVILCCMRLAHLGFNITLSSFMVKCQEMFARRYETSVPFPIFDSVCREMFHHNKSFFTPVCSSSPSAKLDQHYGNLSNLYSSLSQPSQKIEANQVFMFDMQTIRISVDENDAKYLPNNNRVGKRKIKHALATLLWSSNASAKKLKPALLITPFEATITSALTGTPFETSFNPNSKSKLVVMTEKSGIATRKNVQQYFRQLISSVERSPAVILCSEDSLYFSESLVSTCLANKVFLFNVHPDIAKLSFPGRHGGLNKLISDKAPLPSIHQLALRVENLLTSDLSRLKASTLRAFTSSGAFPVNRNAPNQYRTKPPFAGAISQEVPSSRGNPAVNPLETPELVEDSCDNDSVMSSVSRASEDSSAEKSEEGGKKEEVEKVPDSTHRSPIAGERDGLNVNVTQLRPSRLVTPGTLALETGGNRLTKQTVLRDEDKMEEKESVKRSKPLVYYRQVLKRVLRGPIKKGSYKYKPLKPLKPLKPVTKTVVGSSVISTLSFKNVLSSSHSARKEVKDAASLGPISIWSMYKPSEREETASPKLVIDETVSADAKDKSLGPEIIETKGKATSLPLINKVLSEKEREARNAVSRNIQAAIEAVVEASREYARQVERGGVHGEEIMPEKWIMRHGGKSNAVKGSSTVSTVETRDVMKTASKAEEVEENEEEEEDVSGGKDQDVESEEDEEGQEEKEETIGKDDEEEEEEEVEKEEEDGEDAEIDSSDDEEKDEADEWIVSSRPKQETVSEKEKHKEKKKKKRKKQKSQEKSGDEEGLSDSSEEKRHKKKKSKKRKKKKKKAEKKKKKHRHKLDDPNQSVGELEKGNLDKEVNLGDNTEGSNCTNSAPTNKDRGAIECEDTQPSYVADHDYFSKFVDEDEANGEENQKVSKDLMGSSSDSEANKTQDLEGQNKEGQQVGSNMESDAGLENSSTLEAEDKDNSKSSSDSASSSSSDSESSDNDDQDSSSSSKDTSDTSSADSEAEEASTDSGSEQDDSQQKDGEASSSNNNNSSSSEDSSAESESSDDESKQKNSKTAANDSSEEEEDEEESEEDMCQLCMRSTPPHSKDVIIDWVDCDKNCGRWFHVICIKNSKFRPKSKSKNIKHYVCPSCRD